MYCEPATVAVAPASKRLQAEVLRLASTPRSTVSVVGELGVGKQAWARRLHAESARAAGPFVVLEPGRPLAEPVLASAEGGTLFLREVAALDDAQQGLLTELLGDRSAPTAEDDPGGFRLIAASRLPQPEGLAPLREDLDYRLNVLTLEVGPLRERPEELGELARSLTVRLGRELGLPPRTPSEACLAAWTAHAWPGNLHELEAELRRGLLVAWEAGLDHLECQLGTNKKEDGILRADGGGGAGDLSLDGLEERAVRRALAESGGNRSQAARRLGIHRTTLYHKLRRFGIG